MKLYPPEINEAIRLHKEKLDKQSRQVLCDYFLNQTNLIDILLWLAKVSPNKNEAIHAAELAYGINPENEIAQRSITGVRSRFKGTDSFDPHLEILHLTGMSQSQARAVIWPFRGLQKPIGVLLDDETITVRDLAWAAKDVADPFIRQASRTLLLMDLLEEKVNSSEPAKVIQGTNYSEFQETLGTLNFGILLGVIFSIVILYLALGLSSTVFHILPALLVNLFSICSLPFVGALLYMANRSVNTTLLYRQGKEGERKALDALRASLPKPWVIVHNLEWSNRKWGDIDLVLVGPSGLWAIEVKAYSKETRVNGDKWQYKNKWVWHNLTRHPGKQARRNSVRLKEYLDQKGINSGWVQPIIVWAGEEKLLITYEPEIPVWKISEIPEHVEELWRQRRLKEDQIQEISKILDEVIKKTIASKK